MNNSHSGPAVPSETAGETAVDRRRHILTMVGPGTFWMVCFVALPLLLVVLVSFMQRGLYGGIEYQFTLDNYSRIFNPMYIKILWNSLVLSFITTLLCLILGYPFAYFVAKAPKRWRNILLLLVILPFWTNSLVRTYAWIMLLRTEGFINTILLKIGLVSQPLAMMYNETAILIGLVYVLFPFMVLPLITSIEKLDPALLEAAGDLGANPVRAFFGVTLPLTKAGIMAGSILVFIPALGYFFIPELMGGSKAMLISNLVKNQFLTARDWPFGSAISIILMAITLILIYLYFRNAGSKDKLEVF
ncbi:ABC transporter permease [Acetonema longum]|uniref:Putative spermidine/putrescine ABC transporter permease n=1 Tax=Acetonema longum DSM 6540 TaxID=1009370 RepID=F7NET0_9FIRM|nr:ABC transporter permease [Acetonema longum]EGO65491.1 putative spermidine/putrescine ABC transporter permease [Acetonema longum DSM 6540]